MRVTLADVLDWLSPRRCPGCQAPGPAWFCAECGSPEAPPPGLSLEGLPLWVVGRYAGALAQAVRRFKYEPRPELAAPLAALLARELVARTGLREAAWLPVPLSFERLVERGFNQSALIARELAGTFGGPLLTHALRRTRHTAQQAKLGRAEREANLHGAFTLTRRIRQPVILVDDVVTTGSTARACLSVLRAADVPVFAVVALAHAATP
jgi:ComF family protein